MRIQFPMTFEDEIVAKWFGLETARILLDSSYRLLQSAGIRARNDWRSKAGAGSTEINLLGAVFHVAQVPPALTASRDQ